MSERAAPVRLPRRSSPYAGVDDIALEATGDAEADHDGSRSKDEVLKDVRSRSWLAPAFARCQDRSGMGTGLMAA